VPTLHKTITVEAPVDKVFKYMAEPKHLPEIWPSLYKVKEVVTLPKGGHKFAWFYNMAGRQVEGTTETFEWFPNERFVDKTKGDIEATFSWKFFPENGYTKIELEADYMPPKFFPKEELPFVMRRNEFEADLILENLTARFEI
jgi:uncharacterized protein YndB with AHSA1/START domain